MYREAAELSVGLWHNLTTDAISITEEHSAILQERVDSFPALGVRQSTNPDGTPAVTSATTPQEYVYFYALGKLREAEKYPIWR